MRQLDELEGEGFTFKKKEKTVTLDTVLLT